MFYKSRPQKLRLWEKHLLQPLFLVARKLCPQPRHVEDDVLCEVEHRFHVVSVGFSARWPASVRRFIHLKFRATSHSFPLVIKTVFCPQCIEVMGTKQAFPDRREIMFGRKTDIDFILDRIQKKGLTAVVGRPKMGKTWLLQEVCWRLSETGHLVGYHECLGESDQMLHVVSDLYSRWLLAAGNIEQARSLLERHKDSWVSKAGNRQQGFPQ